MRLRPFAMCAPLLLVSIGSIPAPPLAAETPPVCGAYQGGKTVPQDFDDCADLESQARNPAAFMDSSTGAFKLDEYEILLSEFMRRYCYRDADAGWKRDKRVRDVGPYAAFQQANGTWANAKYWGTHQPVVIWYNDTMYRWLKNNRPAEQPAVADPAPIDDGAFMVKEMYEAPAAKCAAFKPELLEPSSVAIMIRDNKNAQDGWFWASWWDGFEPDWPAPEGSPLPNMGFGQYCLNCHASARDNQTFADLKNFQGEPGEPNVYLSQNFLFENSFAGQARPSRHSSVSDTTDDVRFHEKPYKNYADNGGFVKQFKLKDGFSPPLLDQVVKMPSQTYDNVWVAGGELTEHAEFVTSDQCIGCHDAGSTGLQYDMTVPDPETGKLLNLSPYATWRTSPMGLGGRDPIFYAQLASETEAFHPGDSEFIQDTCLGCHGILGQRQHHIDEESGDCKPFLRKFANAIPYPPNSTNPQLANARYGALARDGISCAACHHMDLTGDPAKEPQKEPQNRCVEQRQQTLNPGNTGFAKTFTGSFLVGPPNEVYGPFTDVKTQPMSHALGIEPVYKKEISNSGVCGTCHTIHLPVLHRGGTVGHTYEQTTYPEWAFSAFRTGLAPDGSGWLPSGQGSQPFSCQGCHMRKRASPWKTQDPLFKSKIASIQEYSNFPQSDNTLSPDEIDLQVREGFARHTLVGLNAFFIEMARQLPALLGLRTQDPMLASSGLDPVEFTRRALLEQAAYETADIAVSDVTDDGTTLSAKVTVTSKTGHKFPSGVGFRRAFIEFSVLDADHRVIWESGRTDDLGVIVDEKHEPVAGELWWKTDCSARVAGTDHQPHYRTITAESQVQIYQELVIAPADVDDPKCGPEPVAGGQLTTSFLSICGHVKDNRLLPTGFLPLEERIKIAKALGAGDGKDLATDSGPYPRNLGDIDPDYKTGGGDSLVYKVDLSKFANKPKPFSVQATLYYQSIPPFYLQDRFCTSKSADTQRLYYLAGNLNLDEPLEQWKLEVASSGLLELGDAQD